MSEIETSMHNSTLLSNFKMNELPVLHDKFVHLVEILFENEQAQYDRLVKLLQDIYEIVTKDMMIHGHRKGSSCSGIGDAFLTVPKDFCCPISLDLMKDPVIVSTGQTYDRTSIVRWIDEGHCTCPNSGQLLTHTILIPNRALRSLISHWCAAHGVPYDPPEASDGCAESLVSSAISRAAVEANRATSTPSSLAIVPWQLSPRLVLRRGVLPSPPTWRAPQSVGEYLIAEGREDGGSAGSSAQSVESSAPKIIAVHQ